jgi:hypothetical protein
MRLNIKNHKRITNSHHWTSFLGKMQRISSLRANDLQFYQALARKGDRPFSNFTAQSAKSLSGEFSRVGIRG